MSSLQGFTDSQVDFWTEAIERKHPEWSVHQRYHTDGWAIGIYDEFRLLGEYMPGAEKTLRRFAGLPEPEVERVAC